MFPGLHGSHPQEIPDKVLNMIAYTLTTVRAQQEFEDLGWRIYDHNYRLKAAASGNQNWAELDPHLYNQCFTDQAKKVLSCAKCNSFRHAQYLSHLYRQRVRPTEANQTTTGGKIRGGICFAFDWDGSCPYTPCKFTHMCSRCLGCHPSSQCRSGKGHEEVGALPRIGGEDPKVTILELLGS